MRPTRQSLQRLGHYVAAPRRHPPTQRRHRRHPRSAEVLVQRLPPRHRQSDCPVTPSVWLAHRASGSAICPPQGRQTRRGRSRRHQVRRAHDPGPRAAIRHVNGALQDGPVSLPDAVAMLDVAITTIPECTSLRREISDGRTGARRVLGASRPRPLVVRVAPPLRPSWRRVRESHGSGGRGPRARCAAPSACPIVTAVALRNFPRRSADSPRPSPGPTTAMRSRPTNTPASPLSRM